MAIRQHPKARQQRYTLGAAALVLLAGVAAGSLIAPRLFGTSPIGSDRPLPVSLPLGDTVSSTVTGQTDSLAAIPVSTTVLDWEAPPLFGTGSADLEEAEIRLNTALGEVYSQIGTAGSLLFVHREFYPFESLGDSRYYSALVDRTFVSDADGQVLSGVCEGRVPAAQDTCRFEP